MVTGLATVNGNIRSELVTLTSEFAGAR